MAPGVDFLTGTVINSVYKIS